MSLFDHKYPYTDFHEMNLDWIISKIVELENFVYNDIEKIIRERIKELIIDAVYDPGTETLVITIEPQV